MPASGRSVNEFMNTEPIKLRMRGRFKPFVLPRSLVSRDVIVVLRDDALECGDSSPLSAGDLSPSDGEARAGAGRARLADKSASGKR